MSTPVNEFGVSIYEEAEKRALQVEKAKRFLRRNVPGEFCDMYKACEECPENNRCKEVNICGKQ